MLAGLGPHPGEGTTETPMFEVALSPKPSGNGPPASSWMCPWSPSPRRSTVPAGSRCSRSRVKFFPGQMFFRDFFLLFYFIFYLYLTFLASTLRTQVWLSNWQVCPAVEAGLLVRGPRRCSQVPVLDAVQGIEAGVVILALAGAVGKRMVGNLPLQTCSRPLRV